MTALYVVFPKEGSLLWGTTLAFAILGFALQPYLRDVIAGASMMTEGWFEIGDWVHIEPMQVSGVVEHFNLRSTRLRTLAGEKVLIHNGAIWSASVARRGIKQFRLELFVKDLEEGEVLVTQVAALMPKKNTHVVHALEVIDKESMEEGMHRITCTCSTPAGREWIVEDLAVKLFKERDRKGIVVHGPVVYSADPVAERRISQSVLPI